MLSVLNKMNKMLLSPITLNIRKPEMFSYKLFGFSSPL